MVNKECLNKFRDLLAFAIGNKRTQLQFANDAGLSRYHINRLMNNDDIGRPSQQTLRKIANASEGRVQIEQLVEALGDKVIEEKYVEGKAPVIGPLDEYRKITEEIRTLIDDFKTSMLDRCQKTIRYNNIWSFLDSVKRLNNLTMIDCGLEDSKDYAKNDHHNAEKAVNVACVIDNKDVFVTFGMVLYYCETKGGGFVFFDAAFDLPSLVDNGHELATRMMIKLSEKKDSVISDHKTVAFIKWRKPEIVLEHDQNMKALLATLKLVSLKKDATEDDIQEVRNLIKDKGISVNVENLAELAALLIAAGDDDSFFDFDECFSDEDEDCDQLD